MEENGDDLSSPFWLPTSRTHRRSDRIRHSFSSLFFSSGLLIILLIFTAIFFLLFVVPSTLSFSAQIFKPNSVKKSWESLNLILVLFALLFGFLSRNKNEDRISNTPIIRNEYPTREVNESSLPATPRKWYDFSDQNQMVYNYSSSVSNRGHGFLRTSSSYPDLREVSSQVEFTDDPWRFSDDLNWATGSGQLLGRQSWKHVSDDAVVNKRNRISEVSINDVTSPPVTPLPDLPISPPSPPPLPTPEPALREEKPNESRKSRNLGHKRGRNKRKDAEIENLKPISPHVAPPPPPPPLPHFADPKSSKSHKKRSGGNATKDFFNSLYHKKKKKQRQKSVENFDSLFYQNQLTPPSPPLVPLPENISSSKKSTRKRKDVVVSAASTSSAAISAEPKISQFLTVAMKPPPKSVKVSNFSTAEENASSGGESPVVNIPPPPPPPPCFSKSLAWKFVLQGDYVRVDSMSSSRSGSPEPDDTESDATPTAGDVPPAKMSSLFCPSPDVNTKADNFISSFRAGLKLEKVNSMKNKHGLGLSNLGPASNPNKR